jgi:hypothetical protein
MNRNTISLPLVGKTDKIDAILAKFLWNLSQQKISLETPNMWAVCGGYSCFFFSLSLSFVFFFWSFSTTCHHLVSIETTLKLNLLVIMWRLGKSRAASVVDVNLGHGPKLCNGWKRTTNTRQGGIKEILSILGISTLVGIYCSCLEFITLVTCLAIISPRSQYL